MNLTFCVSCHPSLTGSASLPLSSHLQQDFLYFSTLLSVHSKLCFSNTSSHVSSPLFVAAAVLKQVLDAIWPAGKSVLLDGISAPVWEGKRERDKMLKRERATSLCAAETSRVRWPVSVKLAGKRVFELLMWIVFFLYSQLYRTNKHCYLQQKHGSRGRICLSPLKGINLDKRFTVLVTAWETQAATELVKRLIRIQMFHSFKPKVSKIRCTVGWCTVLIKTQRSPEQGDLANYGCWCFLCSAALFEITSGD